MTQVGFSASYAGRCGNCGELFVPGAEVFYDNDVLTVVECCGAELRAEPRPAVLGDAAPGEVMPRGRIARDRCDVCFQIPASNGVCGCS